LAGESRPVPSAPRDLRDSRLFRVGALVALLLVALLVSRGCAASDREVSQEQAEEIAREATPFEPDRVQIRLIQQGIPPRAVWAVSLYDVDANDTPTRQNLVLVDGRTGEIVGG
jgi:uncharacterized lipoprotein YbaY